MGKDVLLEGVIEVNAIDDYLSGVPQEQRAALDALREAVAEAAPGATEGISYGMPAFRYRGRPLVGFAAFKRHCSLFPMGHDVLDELGDEVADFRTAKGTLQFTPDKPIPHSLVGKIVRARMQEIETRKE
jgi:uncharacterized protein YdhG (YjbR/CyaY superfamily)